MKKAIWIQVTHMCVNIDREHRCHMTWYTSSYNGFLLPWYSMCEQEEEKIWFKKGFLSTLRKLFTWATLVFLSHGTQICKVVCAISCCVLPSQNEHMWESRYFFPQGHLKLISPYHACYNFIIEATHRNTILELQLRNLPQINLMNNIKDELCLMLFTNS